MPYEIRKVEGGFKVGKKNSSKTFSKKPQTKARARKQLAALKIHTDETALNPAKILFAATSVLKG